MVELFLNSTQDAPFKAWLTQHPNGFYLNEAQQGNIKNGTGGTILHKVGCHHLGSGEGVISTTYAKAASDSRDALRGWAQGKGLSVVFCSSCKPGE